MFNHVLEQSTELLSQLAGLDLENSLEFGGLSEKVGSKYGVFTVKLVCGSLEFGGLSEKVDQNMDFSLFS